MCSHNAERGPSSCFSPGTSESFSQSDGVDLKGGQAVEITLRGKEVATLVPAKTGKSRRARFDPVEQRKWMTEVFGDKVFTDNIVTETRREKDW